MTLSTPFVLYSPYGWYSTNMDYRRLKVGPVAEAILGTIAAAGVISIAVCAPNALQILRPFFKEKKYSPKRAVDKSIESLIKTGLVKREWNRNGDPVLTLTRRGKWESFLRRKLDDKKTMKWDGKWRVVIFDVPNSKAKLRQELRRGMRLYGFLMLQKSVWIYPYPCDEFVAILREHLELADDVLYLTVSFLENDKKYQKKFKL